ncbi:beta-ketoacyl synthase N-terminal-like domain-containing protein [Streptomyces lavendulocolor]|uniref:beta-ketoacyl synthase N-terminal-like domain-containing protein n=1 Tax=Streptomyces lavendulocolor TaxID=67316 RepID=UPI0033EE85EA
MTSPNTPIAIVGMAVYLPGAPDLQTYWRNLSEGRDSINNLRQEYRDGGGYRLGDGAETALEVQSYGGRGGCVNRLTSQDAAVLGLAPDKASLAAQDQLIALRVATDALADAGRLPPRQRIGLIIGCSEPVGSPGSSTPHLPARPGRPRSQSQQCKRAAAHAAAAQRASTTPWRGAPPFSITSFLTHHLHLRGPAFVLDAAGASSLVAIDQAMSTLSAGRCDLVLAGGIHYGYGSHSNGGSIQQSLLSPNWRSRPLHCDAEGVVPGEGAGMIALKRLADAERDNDRIYAVIRGSGVTSGSHASAQADAIRQAWHRAGLEPRATGSIGLLEANAAGSSVADTAELSALADVFGGPTIGIQPVIGSVKSMIGHTMAAAGVAGLIKTALAIHHRMIPPTLHCDDPDPALAATRFRVAASARPWGTGSHPRRAAVSAVATAGVSAHMILEQAPLPDLPSAPAVRLSVREPERVLALAGTTPSDVAEQLAADDSALLSSGDLSHPPVGSTRLGLVAPTPKRLALARRVVAQGLPWRGRSDIWFTPRPLLSPARSKLAFVFPGLEGTFEPRTEDIAQYFQLPQPNLKGFDQTAVGNIGRHGLAVVGVGRLLNTALRRMGIVPDAVAGHSVGEWTAMTVGGLYNSDEVDSFIESIDPDAVAVPGLSFAVLGTSATGARAAINDHGDNRIVLSHDNAPNQSIICGPAGPVEGLTRSLRDRGIICRVLPFQSGFHTPMLAPYLGPIRQAAEALTLHPPSVSVWSATTTSPFPASASEVRDLFIRHLLEPVRFRPLIEAMYAAGYRAFVQLGPGQLSSLISDTLTTLGHPHLTITANSPHRDGLAQLHRVSTALWVEGAPVAPSLPPPGRPHLHATAVKSPSPGSTQHAEAVPAPAHEPESKPHQADDGTPFKKGRESTQPRPVPTTMPPPTDQVAALASVAPFPAAAELGALLRETAEAAEAIIAAASATHQGPSSRTATKQQLHVSLESMPYLHDHCFFLQRPGWPEPADRWPVVPATTIVHHLMEAAQQAGPGPGTHPVAVHGARFDQWVPAAPPLNVTLTATPTSPVLIDVAFSERARATIELAPHYPDPPTPWPCDTTADRTPEITAAELYSKRWMFHGPAFQGITELIAIGDTYARGTITTPAAPGALLDNVGQLIGYWIMATQTTQTVIFPTQIRHIQFFGRNPAPGTQLTCDIRIVAMTDTGLEANAQLLHNGVVWAELTGWRNRRFYSHPETTPASRFPEQHTLSRLQPGGWTLVHERWQDLASRDLIMRNHLGSAERADYDRQPPRSRRNWLLGRIAAKDAVRHQLWQHNSGPIFPAEVRISNHEDGRPYGLGVHGRALPPLDISLAHRGEAAVAIARPHSNGQAVPGIGIDIEEISERSETTVTIALSDTERDLLDTLSQPDGNSRAQWFTRFWACKEAVAKAEGTGLQGRPRSFVITRASRERLLVTATAGSIHRHYLVHCTSVSNPSGLPERHYIVAWTTGPDQKPGE